MFATYIVTILAYFLYPCGFLKALPVVILSHRSNKLIKLAFLAAAVGDFLLDNDWDVFTGTIAFICANFIFGVSFFLENLESYPNHWYYHLFINWTNLFLALIWLIVATFLITQVGDKARLFTIYSWFMFFNVSQSFKLQKSYYTRYFVFLFMISDIMVLIQYLPLHEHFLTKAGAQIKLEQVLHFIGLCIYWTAMLGIHCTFNS